MRSVYVGISGDFIHHGIINVIEQAASLGEVVVGCLTDQAISEYKPLPILTFEQRKKVIENIKGVSKVVEQNEWDYSINLSILQPDIMVHGDDWTDGSMVWVRDNCIKVLQSYGGKLVEIPYTPNISATAIGVDLHLNRAAPAQRQKLLRRPVSYTHLTLPTN